jgi:gliding-associated putative ABC transporter substrate-binding component GldG
MAQKKISYGTNFILVILITLGILTVINMMSFRRFFRIDLTQNKEYTISDSTKNILAGLDDVVNVKVYFAKKLPSYIATLTNKIKDTLEEYNVYAAGNIAIEYIDPADNPAMAQKMRFLGIPQVRLNIIERDQAQFVNVYLGVAILYGDNKEIIPALTDTYNLEYELTSKILRVTSPKVQTIGFLSGHGEPDLNQEMNSINTALQEHYWTRKVETKDGQKIPSDIAALVIAGPKKLAERDKFEIDQYIMSGGKVLFLIDSIELEKARLAANPVESNVEDLLEHYGVKVVKELVLDRLNANATFQTGLYNISVPYPFWVKIMGEYFASDHPIVNRLESMVLPWAGHLEILEDRIPTIEVTELARSTKYSWIQKGFFDLNPKNQYSPNQDAMKSRTMAIALAGTFKSFFADKTIPPVEKKDKEEEQAGADKGNNNQKKEQVADEDREILKESVDTKIIVVGNGRFITENFDMQFEGNRIFFLNAIDWCTIGDYLMGIRSRESADRPLMIIPDRARSAIRYVNIFGVSILLMLFGLGRFYMHRRRKRFGIWEI